MAAIHSKDTKPEILVRQYLHSRGFRYRLHRKDLAGSPDVVLPKYKTVIFVNGCYWHRHEGCRYATTPKSNVEFWLNKFSESVSRDKNNYNYLTKSGWKVIIIWECEVKNGIFKNIIDKEVNK